MALTANVVWGRIPSVAEQEQGHETRTMTRRLTCKAAAEFAADIVFVLNGPAESNAWTEKDYIVSRERPRVEWRDSLKQYWVEVTLMGA